MIHERIKLGRRIRALRTARGLSQERLAEAAGLDRHAIFRTELATNSARSDVLMLIAHALGVPIERLFRDE